jgi:hypothetical protein
MLAIWKKSKVDGPKGVCDNFTKGTLYCNIAINNIW